MSSKTRYILFSAVTLFVFVLSLATPITTYADEGTPPVDAPAIEPGAAPDSPSAEEAPAAEPASDSAAQPSSEPSAALDSPSSEAPALEPAANDSDTQSPNESVTVSEILAQVPAETQVAVINQEGAMEPLATNNAAGILVSGDPYFYNGTQNVGYSTSGTCPATVVICNTVASNPIQAAINAYQATSSASGSIYVEAETYNENVSIDASLGRLTNLTGLIGAGSGTTILNGSIYVTNLTIPFTLSGFTVQNSIPTVQNPTGNGISISGTANINVSDVIVNKAAGAGAYLDTCVAVGGVCTGTGTVDVTSGQFIDNGSSGLFVNSANNVTFTSVNANDNGYYGADLVDHTAAGDVLITGSNFNNNDDKGLSVITNGMITLNNVNANFNNDGAYLDALNDISLTNSYFDDNDSTGLYSLTPGNVLLDNVSASRNGVTGAYIDARSGLGGITVRNSVFFSNGDLGLKGMTGKGAISLIDVTINGDNDTNRGAWLKTFDGGNVLVQNSLFENNLGDGFEIISSGKVDLVNNTRAITNGANGGAIYSTWSYACFGPRGIVVTADAGAFQNNGGYGLYVSPGPEGSFVRLNNPLFAGNLLGNFFLDLEDHCIAGPCTDPGTTPDPKPTPEKKPINEVIVPETGGEPVAQDCENTSGTLLEFENGTSVKVGCPFSGESQIEAVEKDKLPHELPVGPNFVSAVSVDLTKDGEPVEGMTEGGKITLSFKIPADMKNGHFSILYWDPNAKDGAGDWVELPLDQFGGAEFPLNPDDPNDKRTIFSGLEVHGDTVTVTVNFPGVFALVSR